MDSAAGSGSRADVRVEELYGNSGGGSSNRTGVYGGGGELGHRMHGDGASSQEWSAALPADMQAQIMHLQQQHQQQQQAMHVFSDADLMSEASSDPLIQPQQHAAPLQNYHYQPHLSPSMHQHHHQQQQQPQQHHQQQQHPQHVPLQHQNHDHHQQPQHFDGRQPFHQNTAASMHASYQGSDLYNPLGQPERLGSSSIARTNGIGSLASSTANSSPVVVQQAHPSQHVPHASAHLEPMLQSEATAAATSVPHYSFPLDNSLDAYGQRPPTSGSALHQHHHGIPQGIKAEAPVEGFEMGWQGASEARGSTSLGDQQQDPALSHQHHTLHSGADHASAFFSAANDGQSGSAGLSVIHTPHQQQIVAAQYNYTDHVLSAALASNAHISASAPSSDNGTANDSASALLPSPHYFPAASNISLTDARGNATPTIKEEEEGEDAFRRHQQAFAGIHHHHHHHDVYDAGSAAKTSPFTERPHPLQHHHSTGHLPSAHQQPFQSPAHPTHHFHHSIDYSQQQHMHAHEYASQPDEGHAFVPSFPASHGGDSGGMGMGIDGIHHLGDANNTGMPAVASHSLTRRTKPYLRPTIYQQYTNINAAAMEERAQDMGGDCLSFIDDVIFNYISTPSRLGLGERTVMIMTSKVAQKSYGAEKRFLCPPPMVLLVGSSWWSACHRSADGMVTGGAAGSVASFAGPFQQLGNGGPSDGTNDDSIEPTVLIPPRLGIAMGGEGSTSQQEGVLEWAASSGKLIDTDNPSSEFAISGRSIGRQLFISDTDEKRRHCEALVQISVPAMGSSDRRTLGVFASKPIKVISKPSKKRQSTRNSELGVQHGSTISLFHRLRAQTVSTRYLCVSGAPTWFKGSDGNPFLNTDANTHIPNQGESPSCFVAKTSSWDPFIVYLVDPHTKSPGSAKTSSEGNGHVARDAPPQRQGKDASGKAGEGRPAHYPSPPINALPFAHGGTAIHYNQPVVLQCLNTAVVSPIMVIRKADRGTTVVGSGQPLMPLDPRSPPSGDTYGEPVSQLHKVAFEILEEPQGFDGTASGDASGPGVSGHFLGCLNEDVGLRRPLGPRQWAASGGSSRPTTPMTPMTPSMANMSSSPSFGSDGTFKTEQMMSPAYNVAGMQGRFTAASQQQQQDCAADGGKAKRPRRVSSSVLVQRGERTAASGSGAGSGAVTAAAAARSRRRGQSLSVVGLQNQLQAQQQQHGNSTGFSASTLSPSASATMVGSGGNSGIASSASMGAMPMAGSAGGASAANQQLLRRTSSFGNSLASDVSSLGMMPVNEGGVWTVDVHDSDVWTIVGVDIARHTFYLPPKLVNGVKANARGVDDSIAHLVTVPAPANPITPIPIVHRLSGGPRGDGGGGTTGSGSGAATPAEFVTLIGENLSKDLFIFFGDWRSTHVTVTDRNTIRCAPPPALDDMGVARGRVPITLVRRDGVIFPSDCIYHT